MLIANSFAAGTNGATVTTGGLGTSSGWQWDFVNIPAGQSATYDTTVPFGVFPSVKLACTAGGAGTYGEWLAAAPSAGRSLTSAQQLWFRLWVQQSANPTALHQVFGFTASGTRIGDVVITTAGKLAVRDSAGTTQATSTSVVPSNAWFRIEGYMISSATVGQIQLEYFSTPYATTATETLTTAASLNTNGGVISQVRYGFATASNAGDTFWIAGPACADGGYIGPGAVVLSMIPGAPTSSGFTVVSKPVGGTSLRLKVATDAGLTQNVQFVAAQTPDSYGYVRHAVTGLNAHTQYYCQLADTPSGQAESLIGSAGQVKTLPPAGSPQSFTVAIASCIDSSAVDANPNTGIADWVNWNADVKVFTGDLGYQDPSATDVPTQVAIYELMTSFPGYGMASMLTSGWGYYCRSDHDSTNVDNGDSDNAWTAANIQAALEIFPWGTLGDARNPTVGLYQAWVVGRVRFIMIDIRNTDRSPGANTDNSSKTMLGATQLAWLYSELIQPEPLKVIIADTQWMGNFISGQPDKWWSYGTERSAILSYIAAHTTQVQNVLLIHGDVHAVGVASATTNTWGSFPVYAAAPLRQTGTAVQNMGTFDAWYNNSGGDCRQYGRVTFTDSGSHITVNFQGWDALNQVAQVAQTDVFTATGSGALLTCFP